jgi:hypothetical protein
MRYLNFFKRFLIISFLMASASTAVQAGNYVADRLYIACGGFFTSEPSDSNFATFGVLKLEDNTYKAFDTIFTQSVSDLLIDGDYAYLAADSLLLKYDLKNVTRLNYSKAFKGIKRMAVWGDYILASRWGSGTSYLWLIDKHTLNIVHSFEDVEDETGSLLVVGDTAYVAMPGDWMSDRTHLVVVDLTENEVAYTVDLGEDAAGNNGMFYHEGTIVLVNSIAFGSNYGSVTHYDISLGTFDHVILDDLTVVNGIDLVANQLYIQLDEAIAIYDVITRELTDTAFIESYFPAFAIDTTESGLFAASHTDYFSFGEVYLFDKNAMPLDTTAVHISPEVLAFAYKVKDEVSLAKIEAVQGKLIIYPNPAEDRLNIRLEQFYKPTEALNWQIIDLQGRIVMSGNESLMKQDEFFISAGELEKGVYILNVYTAEASFVSNFIKK